MIAAAAVANTAQPLIRHNSELSSDSRPECRTGASMAFGLYSLLEAGLLVLNAICVLHEDRFLAKVGRLLHCWQGQGAEG